MYYKISVKSITLDACCETGVALMRELIIDKNFTKRTHCLVYTDHPHYLLTFHFYVYLIVSFGKRVILMKGWKIDRKMCNKCDTTPSE